MTRTWKRIGRDRRGAVMGLSLIALPVIFLTCGLCVDTAFGLIARERTAQIAAMAAEAAIERIGNDAEAEEVALRVLASNIGQMSFADNLDYSVDVTGNQVSVQISLETRAYFTQIVGRHAFHVAVSDVRLGS